MITKPKGECRPHAPPCNKAPSRGNVTAPLREIAEVRTNFDQAIAEQERGRHHDVPIHLARVSVDDTASRAHCCRCGRVTVRNRDRSSRPRQLTRRHCHINRFYCPLLG